MKAALKKISSFVMATAVFLSLTPVTGQMILADEAETEAPAAVTETEPVKEKETEKKEAEKPKETVKAPEETEKPEAEAPKETEAAETEAPKETQAAETEDPKETGKAEADTPKETENAETEAPKETEAAETETPKETEKAETEAPKENENDKADEPKETEKTEPEAPKTEDKSEADTPENAPELKATKARKNASFSNVKITDGYLTWNPVNGADCYEIRIDGISTRYNYDEDPVCEFYLDDDIDSFVEEGELERKNSYRVELIAYKDYEYVCDEFANWTGKYKYTPNVSSPRLGSFKATISNGYLTWNSYRDAEAYRIIIDTWRVFEWEYGKKFPINKEIDWLIMAGKIEKKDSYRVRIIAYDEEYNIAAQSVQNYKYSSRANLIKKPGAISGFSIKDGLAKWNKCNGAELYEVSLNDSYMLEISAKTTSDVHANICNLISEGDIRRQGSYKVVIEAVRYDPSGDELVVINRHTFTYKFAKVSNRLAVTGKTAKAKRKKKTTLLRDNVMNFTNYGAGRLSFAKTSGNKKIKIDKNTGNITVKKGLKKKTYKIKVKVSAAGNYGYNAGSKTITIKIKVK